MKGRERWRSIVREASKQSIRAWVPEVTQPTTAKALARSAGLVLVLEPTASARPHRGRARRARAHHLVVGPEGGFSPKELELFEHAVRLGPEVLRTSTAGPGGARRRERRDSGDW